MRFSDGLGSTIVYNEKWKKTILDDNKILICSGKVTWYTAIDMQVLALFDLPYPHQISKQEPQYIKRSKNWWVHHVHSSSDKLAA